MFFLAKCLRESQEFSEERTGKHSEKRLLVNPYGQKIQTGCFLGPRENDVNSEKRGFY